MRLHEVQQWLEETNSDKWRFAKSMPWQPHFYLVRDKMNEPEKFEDVLQFVIDNGTERQYSKNRSFIYFELHGWKYWSMGYAPMFTKILNRARIKQHHPYDQVALRYDTIFDGEKYKTENEKIMEMIGSITGTVLDVGCGTGLLLDYKHIFPWDYTGIDPSRDMLKILAAKHGDYKKRLRLTPLESFVSGSRFDNVIALFSASYIREPSIILDYWNRKGKLFLMFYKPEYSPRTHQVTGVSPKTFYFTAESLAEKFESEVIELSNYLIVKKWK